MDQRFSERWQKWRAAVDLDEYASRWDRLAADGEAVHGEADFVDRFAGHSVLDAGCGMGRIGIELARRGRSVLGVDNDPEMLAYARDRGPDLEWITADLATVDLGRRFDIIVAAGNLLVFVEPGDRPAVVTNLARHLHPGGTLITGSSYDVPFAAGLGLADFDRWCDDAGLSRVERYATWEGDPYDGGDYAVSVHLSPGC